MVSEDDVRKLIIKSKTTSYALAHIINLSIATGEFTQEWKTAFVVPLLKKAGLDPIKKNYRPVSNLQNVSKLTECAFVNQLCLLSDCRFPLPPCLPAYRVGHSTETALVKVQSDIIINMDQQKVPQLFLIDLSSAFDTVDDDILLHIMNSTFVSIGHSFKLV